MIIDIETIKLLWPEVILVVIATWIYVGGTIQHNRTVWATLALVTYGVAAFILLRNESGLWRDLAGGAVFALQGPLLVDYLGQLVRLLALTMGFLFTLVGFHSVQSRLTTEFLGTLMLMTVGVMLVSRANDLAFMFVSLELISIPTYVLLFLGGNQRVAREATAKYFFLSILSSAMLLYGFSFLYGLSGTTLLVGNETTTGIREILSQPSADVGSRQMAWLALVFVFAGLGFKVAAVPFHFYAPDVYQGTTPGNAGLLAVVPKIAGMVALIRIVAFSMPAVADVAWQLAMVVAMLTMTIGNVCALWQRNLRRLLAYSSIAHGGYMLIGFSVSLSGGSATGGIPATILYLIVYAFASAGSFAVLASLSDDQGEVDGIEQLGGIGRSRPLAGAAMAVFMFSLAGIPPLAGFWGKLGLFSGAITIGVSASPHRMWFVALAMVAALNAAVAAAYYLRVIGVMYFGRSPSPRTAGPRPAPTAAAVVCLIVVVLAGVWPGPIVEQASHVDRRAHRGNDRRESIRLTETGFDR